MMMAQVLRKIPPINKMMINWAEKQAPEDQERGRIDAMTQYGLRSQEKLFVESEDYKKANGTT